MQNQDPIEEARRHPLVSYFKSQEKEVPEAEIDRRWEEVARQLKSVQAPRRNRKVWRLYAEVACAAALLAGVLWGGKFYMDRQSHSLEQAIARLDECSIDTARQVLLITHAEQRIEAGKNAQIVYSEKGQASVNQRQVEEAPQKVEYNQLIVPKGKSSQLLLADGTSLHVNAGTKVVYPSVFTGKTREIYVDGEIYIDVKKNTEQPFIVKTPGFDIRVTGTAFNVNAYKAMPESEVVLVRGSIIVTDHAKRETAVKPNELLCLTDGVARSKRQVDASEYTAWTQGYFPLQGRSMESILQRLSFYYGCDLTCEPSVKDLSLRGTIDMSVPLPKVLERIAKIHPIGIRQTTDGYHLFITPNTNL